MRVISSLVLASVLIAPLVQPFGQEKSSHSPKEIHIQPKAADSLPYTGNADTKDLVEHGDQYRLGEGVPQDEAKAAELYRQAAESGSAKGEAFYGEALFEGRGVARDRIAARQLFEKAAATQDARAETDLGIMFLNGLGVPQDSGRAGELLERGAKHGDALAEDYLGILAEYGFSGNANKSEAYKHYVNAAQRGSAWGNLNVGRLHKNAIGVEKNSPEGIKWLLRAASTNSPELLYEWGELRSEASAVAEAMHTLGQMYESETEIAKDMGEATKWYQREREFQRSAANAGWPQAQVGVGCSFLGSSGVPQDLAEAKQWYLKAAEQGNRAAEIQLGLLYLRTDATEPPDYVKAMTWFAKAAEQGSLRAEAYVGDLYRQGLGVPQDYKAALSSYLKATADPRVATVPYCIGHIYQWGGFGVERDYAQAMRWYQIAANKWDPYGDAAIAEMYATGRGVEQNYSEAMQWYQKGADKDSAVAFFGIASLYANGVGRSEDVQIARTWYQKAADKDFKPAKDALASLDDSLYASLRMSYSSDCRITRHETGENTELGPSCQSSSVEVLSPRTQEVNLLPYLNTVIKSLQYYWYRRIPTEACPPLSKTGELVFSLFIQKDGKSAGGKLLASYGIDFTSPDDRLLLLAAGNSIASANPFPPLPSEFASQSLSLHVHFRYNPNPKPSHLDASQDSLRIYPPAPVKIVVGSTQQFSTNVIEPESLGLTWTIVGSNCLGSWSCGTISSSGLYTAPKKVPNSPDIAVAVNVPCKSASSQLTIIQPGPAK